MSNAMLNACWPLRMPAPNKAVLIALADYADDSGVCWPSAAGLCVRTCLSERKVRSAIQWLAQNGAMNINRDTRRTNTFTLTPARYAPTLHGVHPAQDAPSPAQDAPIPLHDVHLPPAQRAPEPSVNHQLEPSKKPQGAQAPAAPLSGNASEKLKSKQKARKAETTFAEYCRQCAEDGVMAVSADDPIYAYADSIKLPDTMLDLAWAWFLAKYENSHKKQRDWPAHFRNAVRGVWGGLWRHDGETWVLTTAGKQLAMQHKVRTPSKADGPTFINDAEYDRLMTATPVSGRMTYAGPRDYSKGVDVDGRF